MDDSPDSGGGYYNENGIYVPSLAEIEEYQRAHGPDEDNIKYGRYMICFCGILLASFLVLRGFKATAFWTRLEDFPTVGSANILPQFLISLVCVYQDERELTHVSSRVEDVCLCPPAYLSSSPRLYCESRQPHMDCGATWALYSNSFDIHLRQLILLGQPVFLPPTFL